MKAEIIATGREILSGDIVDTNTNFITRRLNEAGMEVLYHHVAGDEERKLADLLLESSNRSDIIIVSGGLGPTDDDKSRLAASIAGGVDLKINHEALKTIEEYFIQREIKMPEENYTQAVIPENSTYFENRFGTAPGFYMDINRARVYFLPGVPYELKNIVDTFLIAHIKEYLNIDNHYLSKKITIFGLPESKVGGLLSDFYEKFENKDGNIIDLGIQAVFPHIFVKIYSRGGDEKSLFDIVKKAEDYVVEKLGKNIISMEGETLNQVAGRLLIEKGHTISIAESCTGGLIGNLLTDVPGSSKYFKMSAVTYSNEAKSDILGVDPATIKDNGAVSDNTAKELAYGAMTKGRSVYGLSTTGIAGPTGGVAGKPVGTVFIGLSGPYGVKSFRFERDFKNRLLNKNMFAAAALYYLIKEISS